MKKLILSILFLLAASMTCQSVLASDSMRCRGRLILKNDHITKIDRYCIEPETYYSETGYKTISRYDRFYRAYFYEEVPLVIEHMLFNFGPNKFMREIRLENGRVTSIKTLGYGHNK